ncbi:dihydrodipicolinate synthase family protein [Desulfotomaculum sp. 1211_IL3151]|uniref:dihydrodipicolinate synthase family protein n=1 Tax=Desulfotomaculum sp. 1211_IL3151 TaxID=3084055 RepID=UPI002FDA68CB
MFVHYDVIAVKTIILCFPNDHQNALADWKRLAAIIPLLFAAPNPTPIKHLLFKLGLIDSSEVRLPLTPIPADLQERLDRLVSVPACAAP